MKKYNKNKTKIKTKNQNCLIIKTNKNKFLTKKIYLKKFNNKILVQFYKNLDHIFNIIVTY